MQERLERWMNSLLTAEEITLMSNVMKNKEWSFADSIIQEADSYFNGLVVNVNRK